MKNESFLWSHYEFNLPTANKRNLLKKHIDEVLKASDWTQIPTGELPLSEQIAQQELRAAWMELDNPNIDPDTIELPAYPMMERP